MPAGPLLLGFLTKDAAAHAAWIAGLRGLGITEIARAERGERPVGPIAHGLFVRESSLQDVSEGPTPMMSALIGAPYPLASSPGSAADLSLRALSSRALRKDSAAMSLLGGAFAIAAISPSTATAVLAVDRCAVHNLFYVTTPDGLYFANRASLLADHPAVAHRFDLQSLYDTLYFHCLPGPDAGYRGMRRLLPGQLLHWQEGQTTLANYWEPTYTETSALPLAHLSDELRLAIEVAVARRMPAGPAACFLSGGLDSSTVTGYAARLKPQDTVAYTIGFDAEGYDEMEFARSVARHFKVSHESYYVTPDDIVESLPAIVAEFDAPFGNASAVPTYYCAKTAAAHGHTRILAGDGGDELFGGNERYAKQLVFERYSRLPGALRRGLLEPLAANTPLGLARGVVGKGISYIRQAGVPLPDRLMTYNLLNWIHPATFLSPAFLSSIDTGAPLHRLREIYDAPANVGTINQLLRLDWRLTLADSDLPKVSRMCALAGIEVGYPMLDEGVVDIASRVPPAEKVSQRVLRPFFRSTFGNFLPTSTLTKSKQGFGLPFGVWLAREGRLREFAHHHLTLLENSDLLVKGFRDEFFGGKFQLHPAYFGTLLWVLMTLSIWLQAHKPDYRT